jgi:hypothetical protein
MVSGMQYLAIDAGGFVTQRPLPRCQCEGMSRGVAQHRDVVRGCGVQAIDGVAGGSLLRR